MRPASHSSLLLAALLALSFSSCEGASSDRQKAHHEAQANAYFDKGQYQEALIEYMNVVRLDPNNASAHYRLALIHLKLGGTRNIQTAFGELTKTVDLDKTNREAQLKLGELYLLGNDPSKARERADIVLAAAPQDAEGFILRGRSLLKEQHYAEAITELKKAAAIDPQNITIYIDLSRAYFFAKNNTAAEETLKQALTIDPRSTEAILALGDFYIATGKPQQAESTYTRAVETAPQNQGAYIRLAGLYQRQNKVAEAEHILHKWAAANPLDESPQVHLGDLFTSIGQRDKALASYQRATELNASSPIARDKLISHYLETGNTTSAEIKVKEILDKNKSDLAGRFFNARLSLAKGDIDTAIPMFQGIIKDEPQFAPAHHFLGIAYMKQHKASQARAEFTEAVKLSPAVPESRTALAELFLAEGSTDLALEQAQAAIQLNPRNIRAATIMGDAYLRKGDLAKSKQVYEAIAKAVPNESLGPYRLGLVARAEKQDAKALAYFEDALLKKPSAIEPITQIVAIKIAQGKIEEARERVQRQLELSPIKPLLYNLLGQLWMGKDADRAEAAFKEALNLDDSLLVAYMNLGQIYFKAGKTDRAMKEYEAVLAKDPRSIQAHMMLAIIHTNQQEYDKAKSRYEHILQINSKFAPAANNLAWLMVEQGGNLDVALGHAQTARQQRPEDPYVADTIGWLYYKKNAYLLAISLLKEAVERLPNEAVVQFHYGMARYKNGDMAEAKKALQTSLKLNSSFAGAEEARKTLAEM